MERYIVEDKDFGLSVTPKSVTQAFHHYVQNHSELLEQFHSQLKSIINWFENDNLNRWKFYSSSLLFAYDSDFKKKRPYSQSILVRMIDFAHVFPNNPEQSHYEASRDTNYLYGLHKLDDYLAIAKSELLQVR